MDTRQLIDYLGGRIGRVGDRSAVVDDGGQSWSSPTMPARYTQGEMDERGAVARYYGV